MLGSNKSGEGGGEGGTESVLPVEEPAPPVEEPAVKEPAPAPVEEPLPSSGVRVGNLSGDIMLDMLLPVVVVDAFFTLSFQDNGYEECNGNDLVMMIV